MGCYKITLNLSKPVFNTSNSGTKVNVFGKQTGWYSDPKSSVKVLLYLVVCCRKCSLIIRTRNFCKKTISDTKIIFL